MIPADDLVQFAVARHSRERRIEQECRNETAIASSLAL